MSYTVQTAVKREREPEIKGSRFYAYLVGLTDDAGIPHTVEMLQKPETPAPKIGDVLEGTIEPGRQKEDGTKWPDKFKKAQTGGGFKPRSPAETASIVRQHSQEMALRFAVMQGYPTAYKDITLEDIKTWTDWFQKDAGSSISSEPPIVNPPAIREPAPTIPLDRARKVLEAAQEAGLAEGTTLKPALQAKLVDVGVESGKLGHLNVDQAEDVETFIANETMKESQ